MVPLGVIIYVWLNQGWLTLSLSLRLHDNLYSSGSSSSGGNGLRHTPTSLVRASE